MAPLGYSLSFKKKTFFLLANNTITNHLLTKIAGNGPCFTFVHISIDFDFIYFNQNAKKELDNLANVQLSIPHHIA